MDAAARIVGSILHRSVPPAEYHEMRLSVMAGNIDAQAVTTVGIGGIEYGAIRHDTGSALRVAWRSRAPAPGRWFACGELVPDGKTFTVRGWDGELIGRATSIADGLEAVRHFYSAKAPRGDRPGVVAGPGVP
jgi:hypothetical protein